MALNKDQRYLGGGRLYIERVAEGVLQPKQEIGEVKDFKITANYESVECESEENATPETVDEVVMKKTYTISFSTQQVDKETLLLALLGEVSTKSYSAGDTLPDGTTAGEDMNFNVIDAATLDKVEARLIFVSSPLRGKKKIAIFHRVSLKTSGELLLQSKEFVTIPFEGKVLRDPSIQDGSQFFRVYEEA